MSDFLKIGDVATRLVDGLRPHNRTAEGFVQAAADKAAVDARADFLDRFGRIEPMCESPIEIVLLAAMLNELPAVCLIDSDVWFHGADWTWPKSFLEEADRIGVIVRPQSIVGEYRVDFLIEIRSRSSAASWVAVECDGHDFHERTKQQAARDRRRDRYMALNHIGVLRFTGSEIWVDPTSCAVEIVQHIDRVIGQQFGV